MADFCLLPQKVEELKKAFKEGNVSVLGLMKMQPADRLALFKKYAGSSADGIELAFQKRLVTKNQVRNVVNYLDKLLESGRYSPAKKAEIAKAKSEYLAKVKQRTFSPAEGEAFLDKLAEKTFNGEITEIEAKELFRLNKNTEDALKKYNPEKEEFASEKDAIYYGANKVVEEKYIAQLKGEAEPFTEVLKNRLGEFKLEPYKPKAVMDLGVDAVRTITDNSIALVASVDNSFIGRQGINVLFTNPDVWVDTARGSFLNIFKQLGGQDAMDALMAHIYSRPNFINGNYKKSGVLDVHEEQFPASLSEKIPALGRVFKASEVAFKGSAITMRTALLDRYIETAKNAGITIDKDFLEDMGTIANSLTAKGKWGKHGESPIVKLLLWAPRMIKGNLDLLTAHGLGTGLKTPFARKTAFKNSAKIYAGMIFTIATFGYLLKKLVGAKVEVNPIGSDFGLISVPSESKTARTLGTLTDFVGISSNTYNGRTTFDLTGGKASYIRFLAQFITGKKKNSVSGVVTGNEGQFGSRSRLDYLISFLRGKTTPIFGQVLNVLSGKDFRGQKPTLGTISYGLFVPISIQNALGIFGVGEKDGVNWNDKETKELQQFKEQVGQEEFDKANKLFNDRVKTGEQELFQSDIYKAMDNDAKQKEITKLHDKIKKEIFRQYNFKLK